MKKPVGLLIMVWLAIWIVILFLAFSLSGCSTKYQVNRMKLFAVKYPQDFSILANQLNPCFDGKVKADTVITIGKPDTTISYTGADSKLGGRYDFNSDTSTTSGIVNGVLMDDSGDTTTAGKFVSPFDYANYPITKTIRIPVYTTIHDTIKDEREIASFQAQIKTANDKSLVSDTKLTDKTKALAAWRLWCIIGWVCFLALLVIIIYGWVSGWSIIGWAKKFI